MQLCASCPQGKGQARETGTYQDPRAQDPPWSTTGDGRRPRGWHLDTRVGRAFAPTTSSLCLTSFFLQLSRAPDPAHPRRAGETPPLAQGRRHLVTPDRVSTELKMNVESFPQSLVRCRLRQSRYKWATSSRFVPKIMNGASLSKGSPLASKSCACPINKSINIVGWERPPVTKDGTVPAHRCGSWMSRAIARRAGGQRQHLQHERRLPSVCVLGLSSLELASVLSRMFGVNLSENTSALTSSNKQIPAC